MKCFSYRVYDKKEKQYSDATFSIDQYGIVYIQDEDGYWEEIDEERYVVELCTGLEDKNGKMIHEGDIMDDGNHICKIKWSEHTTAFEALNENEGYESKVWFEAKYGEVIGNVHDNPELLKESK